MHRRGGWLLVPGLLGLGLGCVGPNVLPQRTVVPGEAVPVTDQAFVPGAVRTVAAGGVLFQARESWVAPRYPSYVVTDRPLELVTEAGTFRLPLGRLLSYSNTVTIDGVDYVLYLNAHDDDGLGEILYFRPDLTLGPFLYIRDKLAFPKGLVKILRTAPAQVRLPGRVATGAVPDKGERVRQCRFTGRDDQGIHLLYQEFAADPSHASFTRRLDFPGHATVLDCFGTRIHVQRCSGEEMVFSVTDAGQ